MGRIWKPTGLATLCALSAVLLPGLIPAPVAAEPAHAIAMHGKPALPAGFSHMPYANPDAPKGGRLTFGLVGTFDSLNPFIVKGLAVQQIRGYVVESLMTRGQNEPFTLYGLLAQSVDTDDARSYVTFHLDPRARFSDGKPVLARDVLFSWQLFRDHGRPNHRLYYAKVAKADALDERTVRFDFGGTGDRELPLILGLMPIVAEHAIDPATFEETSFTAPLGSGPYRVSAVKAGTSVTLTRNPDYWGRDLPVNRGCGISTKCVSTSFARPTARSRLSSAACTIFASKPNRCAGTRVTTFPQHSAAR
jgi:peptide/nickel transport system substrate-binding protein